MIYLIDFENVNEQGLIGIENLDKADKLLLFYSKNANRISIDNHLKLEEKVSLIEYIEVNPNGNNALDFQLVTYLGFLVAKNPKNSYTIISKDKGYNSVINFWKNKGITINLQSKIIKEKNNMKTNDSSTELQKQIKKILPNDKEKIEFITSTIIKYKSKIEIHNAIIKRYKNPTASVIYNVIKPLIKNK